MRLQRITLALVSLILLFVATTSLVPITAHAAPLDEICNSGNTGESSVCNDNKKSGDPILGPSGILTKAIQILIYIVGVASVIMIIVGGLRYILSNGDANSVNSAKNSIIYALVGIVVAILAQSIVTFVLKKL